MIHQAFESSMQIFLIVMAFQSDNGIRHAEQMHVAFTSEDKCETYAKEVLRNHYKRINGLYWWCEELDVNP